MILPNNLLCFLTKNARSLKKEKSTPDKFVNECFKNPSILYIDQINGYFLLFTANNHWL